MSNRKWFRNVRAVALSAAFAIVALVTGPTRAQAGCSMPSGLLAAISGQVNESHAASQCQDQQTLPLGGNEPIFGLWQIAATFPGGGVDHVISGWTRDGLEFDQDISPILTGYVCYGTYVKLEKGSYGLTHPFFNFQSVNDNGEGTEATEGQWDGTSGFFDYTVTVSKDGKSFTGKQNFKVVQGPNPYDPNAAVLFTTTATLSATKVGVDTSQLP
jgi:hypothetical protein